MTPIDSIKHRIAELRKLEVEATPAPWKGDEFEIVAPKAPTLIGGNVRLILADDYHMNEWDADFIIKYRNAASPLLSALEQAVEALSIIQRMGKGDISDCFHDVANEYLTAIARTLEAG